MLEEKIVPVDYLKGHTDAVEGLAFSSDSRFALSGGQDKIMILWDIQAKEILKIFRGHQSNVWSCAFSPDDRFALSGSGDKTIKLWDISTGNLVRTFRGHGSWVMTAIFSRDGKWIYSGSYDGTVRIWSTATGEQIHLFKLNGEIGNITSSNDDNYIFASNYKSELFLLDTTSGEILWGNKFYEEPGGINGLFLSKFNHAIITSDKGPVILIEIPNGNILWKIKLDDFGDAFEIWLSSDGNKMFVTSNFSIETWDIVNFKLLKSVTTQDDALIESAAFSPDDHWALTGNYIPELILWDLTI
jgi:WD40 repeat protein